MKNDWIVFAWIAGMHLGALAGFFTFSWPALGVCLFLWWLTGGIGICLGYHRYFTHRSFETPKFVEYILAIVGCMAGESGPIGWVAAHRVHHIYSDTEQDPHSPLKYPNNPVKGFIWAHVWWLFGRDKALMDVEHCKRYTPDMARDRFLVWLDEYHLVPTAILAVVLWFMGGWPFIVWGIFVRSVLVYHATWFVNSATHVWGYKNFNTTDDSRNNLWVTLLAFGEGWHNNHHAIQRSARHGMRWWEIDITYRTIQLMWVFGLAKNIHVPVEAKEKAELGFTVPVMEFGKPPVAAAAAK